MSEPSVSRSGVSHDQRLKKALRRVRWRAFWFTLLHPLACRQDRIAHRDRTIQQFREEMRDA